MANKREPVLTVQDIEQLKRKINPETGKNYTQAEIAEMHGVTPQYISWIKKQAFSYSQTPRERAMEHFPWTVGVQFVNASPHRLLRDHAEYMATGGKGMSPDRVRRLMGFYRRLEKENVVVEFDPEIPPSEGISTGGFAYRQRRDSDGDLIIRVNAHTELTDEGRMIFTLPKEEKRRLAGLRS